MIDLNILYHAKQVALIRAQWSLTPLERDEQTRIADGYTEQIRIIRSACYGVL